MIESETHLVKDISLCFGGMSYVTLSAAKTEQSLVDRYVCMEML